MSPSQKFSRHNSGSKPPSSTRYLQTRLKILGRPGVWGAVSILLLASYGLFQYWGSLDQSVDSGQDAIDNPARRDSLNSGSDFDSSDFGNLPISNTPQPYVTPGLTSPGLPSTSPRAAGLPTKPNTFNPFATHSVVASPSGGDGLALPSAVSEVSGNPDSVGSGTARPISPLQSGLDRNLAPKQDLYSSNPMDKNSASPPGNSGGSRGDSLGGSNPTETMLAPTMLAPMGAAQFQPYVPRTSPPPGSTGYTLPPAFRTPSNSGLNDASDFNNFSRPQPLPGFTSTQPRQSIGSQMTGSQTAGSQVPQYQLPQYQLPQYLSPPNDPFSVPRTTPGRSIGGGQINTFSNP
ncbi:MAG: hypothetical protein KME15_21400 [Drouetiella hepatica Uher 2000/2452]|jgi:hypothetical protein|uniref:Uncharacterized protein n=1 Tax=Drouetiella hepatica Uher 2000/2452 TaxID=904376 RepID=A0A951QEM1_9CYAN|nr:hypothetical protein [Drouetiella hepatica Uher 2000/2452]